MSTPYKIPIEAFLRRIEKDRDFFNYINLTPEQSLEIAKERAKGYLKEAIGKLTLCCAPDINFYDYDDISEIFNNDWTGQEIFLISSLMYEMHLDRDIAKLKCLNVNFTSSDLKVFDPSNARSTFMEMYKDVCEKNGKLLDEYSNRDRITGKLKGINYPLYDE
ncbi:hypothetical protein [Anaerovorax sp. IOR16]|uniref:hypothetical protein n=1 Tax=Anaerovorax sp. IOR16 TaxID=2773458 RepID=UPI0019D0C763|nr:hypothetical protein [Anaerovorax sp. IOR16]